MQGNFEKIKNSTQFFDCGKRENLEEMSQIKICWRTISEESTDGQTDMTDVPLEAITMGANKVSYLANTPFKSKFGARRFVGRIYR